MKIMQGDSYAIPIRLTQGGYALTPEMVDEVEISVGEALIKKFTAGGVVYDKASQQWYIRPTQAETLALEAGENYQVIARVKYKNVPADVKGVNIGSIDVEDTFSTEVI